MAISFGSIGDIVATIQIAAKLLEILNDGLGSAREFQDLIVELRAYHRVLDDVLKSWQVREQSPRLDTLIDIALPVTRDCQAIITDFLDTIIRKYGTSFTRPNSRRDLKIIGKMLQWSLFETDKISRLREKLRSGHTVLILVKAQAQELAEEQDQSLMFTKLTAMMNLEEQICSGLNERFERIESQAQQQLNELTNISDKVSNITSTLTPVTRAALDTRDMVQSIQELLTTKLTFETLTPFSQQPTIFEDAFGVAFPVQLEIIRSWATIHSILNDRFSDRPGGSLVRSHRYVLRDDLSGRALLWNTPPHFSIRPGQKVNMSMLYYSELATANVCPRCNTVTVSSMGTETTCSNSRCQMIYQRVTDMTEAEEADGYLISEISKELVQGPRGGQNFHIEDNIPADLIQNQENYPGAAIFKRVQFFTRWEDRLDSRGELFHRIGDYSIWYSTQGDVRARMSLDLDHLRDSHLDWFFRGMSKGTWAAYAILFMGKTIGQSKPVIMVYSEEKKLRRRILKKFKLVKWLRSNSSFLLVTCTEVHFRDKVEEAYRQRYVGLE